MPKTVKSDGGEEPGLFDNPGAEQKTTGEHGDVWAEIATDRSIGEGAELEVNGFWYDDEEGSVELKLSGQHGRAVFTLNPEAALELAADIEVAAAHATYPEGES